MKLKREPLYIIVSENIVSDIKKIIEVIFFFLRYARVNSAYQWTWQKLLPNVTINVILGLV